MFVIKVFSLGVSWLMWLWKQAASDAFCLDGDIWRIWTHKRRKRVISHLELAAFDGQNIRLVSADIELSVLAPAMMADQGEHGSLVIFWWSPSLNIVCVLFCSRWKVRVIYRQVKRKIQRWITVRKWRLNELARCSVPAASCTLTHSQRHVQVRPSSWVKWMLWQGMCRILHSLSGEAGGSESVLVRDTAESSQETLNFDVPSCRQTLFFPLSKVFHCSMLSLFAGANNQSENHLAGLLCQTRVWQRGYSLIAFPFP